MMSKLQIVWNEMLPKLEQFSKEQKEVIQAVVYSVLGTYNFEKKAECTDLVVANEQNKGYIMFFVAKQVEGKSQKSLKYYKMIIDRVLENFNKPLSEITTDDIRCYLAARQIRDKVTKVTIDNERRILSSFFGWLASEDYIKKNIMYNVKEIKKPQVKKRAFTETEIEKIRDSCNKLETDEKKKRARALVEFLLSTGCRVGEVSQLKKSDIDLDNKQAVVFGKGDKERYVFLTQNAKMRLLEYWNCCKHKSDKIFTSVRFDKSMNACSIEKEIRKIGEIAGVENCHPHRFRRTCATMAIKRGMSALDVKKMLGHKEISTTEIYLDLDNTELKHQHEKYM